MKSFVALATLAVMMATAIQAGTISPALQMQLEQGKTLDISIYLEKVSDVFSSPSLLALKGEAKVESMISTLKARTSASQEPFLNVLSRMGKSGDAKTTWITNFIRVKNADKSVVEALASLPGDFLIREPIVAHIIGPVGSREATQAELKQGNVQWGVEKIQSEAAWTKTK
jgi:hypothetical protein